MQDDNFLLQLQHFKKFTNCSDESKVLLLLNGSHLSIKCLDFCKTNGIVLLSFPPHCTHKLQPLDRAVYGLLKKAVNTECDAWKRCHPGKTMSIYDIPSIVKQALPKAVTPSNILNGFRATGIYPLNIASTSTDPEEVICEGNRPLQPVTTERQRQSDDHTSEPVASTSKESVYANNADLDKSSSELERRTNRTPSPSSKAGSVLFSPESVREHPKDPPRIAQKRGRKKRRIAILTDIPVKNKLPSEKEAPSAKKNILKKESTKNTYYKKKKRVTVEESSTDDAEEECFEYYQPRYATKSEKCYFCPRPPLVIEKTFRSVSLKVRKIATRNFSHCMRTEGLNKRPKLIKQRHSRIVEQG